MTGKLGSYDCWAFFRVRGSLVDGNVPLDHKLVFGFGRFNEKLVDDKWGQSKIAFGTKGLGRRSRHPTLRTSMC